MRLGTKSHDEFFQILNQRNEKIQRDFLNKIHDLTKMTSVKVMLGDSTITEQKTFDPVLIQNFFQKIVNFLKNWTIQDISISNNEDIRRIFTKFETRIGNYLLSGHLSIQFHVLLYYKPEYRVIDCQKELSEIIENTKQGESQLADNTDEFILSKLQEMGYKDLDHQQLFEVLFENDKLRNQIYGDVESKTDVDFKKLSNRKKELFNELDSLLIETYQISPVLIDDARLVTGEEGCLCTFDLEHIKNNTKEGLFNPKLISQKTKDEILQRIEEFSKIIKM